MILTITPNPLLDFVIHCPEPPGPGGHRLQRLNYTVGGKGINVARMLKTLGKPALALSFSGGPNGKKIVACLRDQGVPVRFVETANETRTGLNLVIDKPKTQTWWIEDGEDLSEAEIQAFLGLLAQELPRMRYLAMSGTIPGCGNRDFYRRVLETCRVSNAEIYLDARDEALWQALEIGGFFLKHNRDECRQTFKCDPFQSADFPHWATLMRKHRIWGAMITDGPRQALLWEAGTLPVFFQPPVVDEVSAVGSGDAALAGFLYARVNGMTITDATRWAMAAGAADALHPGPCEATFEEVQDQLQRLGSGTSP